METTKEVNQEKVTNLTVQMVYVTPRLAKNYLEFNPKNRKIKDGHVLFLSNEMKQGRWAENGESIIFDKNLNLVDGQHRLRAIIKSGKSYWISIFRGVKKSAIATMDTGSNRSAADVLQMNGFKYSNGVAALIKVIDKYVIRKSKGKGFDKWTRRTILSNQQVLDYCSNNYHWIENIIKRLHSFVNTQKPIVLSVTNLALIIYIIGGENPKEEHYNFIKYLSGTNKESGTAINYIYTKLYNSRINKEPLSFYWILGMSIKAWNYYIDGNPAVRLFKFSIDNPLPKINKI